MISPEILQLKENRWLEYYSRMFGGCYCVFTNGGASCFYKCRVEYQHYALKSFDHNQLVGFMAPNLGKRIEEFNTFWEGIEKQLKLKDKTVIYRTNDDNIIALKIPKFWTKDAIKYSVFTLLLRCGACHNGDLKAYDLTNLSFRAIKRFLDGFTYPNSELQETLYKWRNHIDEWGFVKEFRYDTLEDVRDKLVKKSALTVT